MAEEGSRKSDKFIVVCTTVDVCYTPMGSSTPPIAYQITSTFTDSSDISSNVFFTKEEAFLYNQSFITNVTGDEAGTCGGIKSGTNISRVDPKTASSTVFANKCQVVRHMDECFMNNRNTVGLVYFQDVASKTKIDPVWNQEETGFISGFKEELKAGLNEKVDDVKGMLKTLRDAVGFGEDGSFSKAWNNIWESTKAVTELIQTGYKAKEGDPESIQKIMTMSSAMSEDIINSVEASYSKGGIPQVAGEGTAQAVIIAASMLTDKGVGKALETAKVAKKFNKLAKISEEVEDTAKFIDNAAENIDDATGAVKATQKIESNVDDAVKDGVTVTTKVNDFEGVLKNKKIRLKGVKEKRINYKKRNPKETAKLRKQFNSTEKKKFLKDMTNSPEKITKLKEAGLSETEIAKMQDGLNPSKEWQVHHKLPLDDGGTNAMDNLILIKNDPYHKTITNAQNSLTKGLQVGESKIINWPIPEGNIYPAN